MQPFHITRNLKFAASVATIGAEWLDEEQFKVNGRTEIAFTMAEQAGGITCADAARLWNNSTRESLESQVDAIIAKYGITPEDYAILQLETCRAVLGNRGTMLKCAMDKVPFVCRTLRDGRQLQYREGTPKSELRKLINS